MHACVHTHKKADSYTHSYSGSLLSLLTPASFPISPPNRDKWARGVWLIHFCQGLGDTMPSGRQGRHGPVHVQTHTHTHVHTWMLESLSVHHQKHSTEKKWALSFRLPHLNFKKGVSLLVICAKWRVGMLQWKSGVILHLLTRSPV